MVIRIKASLLVFLLLIICLVSSGIVEGLHNKAKSAYVLRKDGRIIVNGRKLLGHDQVMDYDYTGPNPKHDPRKNKPGKGP